MTVKINFDEDAKQNTYLKRLFKDKDLLELFIYDKLFNNFEDLTKGLALLEFCNKHLFYLGIEPEMNEELQIFIIEDTRNASFSKMFNRIYPNSKITTLIPSARSITNIKNYNIHTLFSKIENYHTGISVENLLLISFLPNSSKQLMENVKNNNTIGNNHFIEVSSLETSDLPSLPTEKHYDTDIIGTDKHIKLWMYI